MITPSRWFTGGRGLDDYRNEMLNDNRIRIICDYVNASECFPGVEIKGGISYFLWDRDNKGKCLFRSFIGGQIVSELERPLLEEDSDILIRYNEAIPIFRKVRKLKEKTIDEIISTQKPFGLRTYFQGEDKMKHGYIKVYANHNIGFIPRTLVTVNLDWINKHKILLPRAIGSGESKDDVVKPIYSEPNSCCTEAYVVLGPFDSKQIVDNVISYIKTRFFHFMLTLKKNTMMASKTVYQFVPLQDFSHPWTDEMLYKKYGLTEEEIAFIESMIRPME
jgi:site-specific DNA-methyltransferase (adenine-specific)